MIAIGILGEYVGRIYEEGKGRPLYLVADTWNLTQRENREAITGYPADSTENKARSAASNGGQGLGQR